MLFLYSDKLTYLPVGPERRRREAKLFNIHAWWRRSETPFIGTLYQIQSAFHFRLSVLWFVFSSVCIREFPTFQLYIRIQKYRWISCNTHTSAHARRTHPYTHHILFAVWGTVAWVLILLGIYLSEERDKQNDLYTFEKRITKWMSRKYIKKSHCLAPPGRKGKRK